MLLCAVVCVCGDVVAVTVGVLLDVQNGYMMMLLVRCGVGLCDIE